MIEEFGDGVGVRSWASILDDKTREQAAKSALLPILTEPIALMADAHLGYGATIGSVIPTESAVIPRRWAWTSDVGWPPGRSI
jgi:tRNA-splicing ligase RtcB (3'-phosphate/5'-hydroxy nucleic acid ligase)